MRAKEVIDIKDWNDEFKKLNDRFFTLENRFLATSMDYKLYIDSSWNEKNIYQFRDDISYRLFSTKFHIELLLRHHINIENQLYERREKDPEYFRRTYVGENPLYQDYSKELSSIFDSLIYHCVSAFDYVSILSNYICGSKNTDKLKWTQLARSVRDDKNSLSKTEIADAIIKIDRDFVGKLYDHRSDVIHKKSDLNKYSITMHFGQTEFKFIPHFFIGDNLIKKFSYFRKLSKTNRITINYAGFWIVNQTIDKITDILFSLKKQMEQNRKTTAMAMYILNEETNEKIPVSRNYWNEDAYLKK